MTPEEKERVEKTIDHARFGLTNAQNTIAFIDKKVAAGIAIVSFILGVAFPKTFAWSAIKLALSRITEINWAVVSVLGCLAFGLISIAFAAIHAYKTIFPRTPSFSREWILFPYSESEVNEECSLYKSIEQKLAGSGMSAKDILEEFRDQLAVLGGIQAKKMSHCKATFSWLGGFLFSMASLVVASFFVKGMASL